MAESICNFLKKKLSVKFRNVKIREQKIICLVYLFFYLWIFSSVIRKKKYMHFAMLYQLKYFQKFTRNYYSKYLT